MKKYLKKTLALTIAIFAVFTFALLPSSAAKCPPHEGTWVENGPPTSTTTLVSSHIYTYLYSRTPKPDGSGYIEEYRSATCFIYQTVTTSYTKDICRYCVIGLGHFNSTNSYSASHSAKCGS